MLGFRFVARLRDRAPLNADRNDARAQGIEGRRCFVIGAEPEAIPAKIKRGHQTLETMH